MVRKAFVIILFAGAVAVSCSGQKQEIVADSAGREDPMVQPAFADESFDPRAIADAEMEAEPEVYDSGVLPPHSDEEVRAVPEMRSRKGLVTVAAVLGLVVLGGAAALGYRMVGEPRDDVPPPVIRADTTPTKVKPEDPGE